MAGPTLHAGKTYQWTSRRDGSPRIYATQFHQVFGVSLEEAWRAWVADERAFQHRNLDEVRKFPLTPYRDVTPRPLGSISRAFYDPASDALYAGLNYPGAVAHVARISTKTGTLDRLVDIKGPLIYTVTSLVWNPSDKQIYYTTDNGAHRDLVRLDPVTHRTRLLQKDARIGDLAYNARDQSIWGVRHLNGLSTLVRMKPPYTDWERVITWPYGTDMYDIDVSPDGTLVSGSFGEISGKQDVRVFEAAAMSQSNPTPVARFDFGTSVPSGFVFSLDRRYLFGSSYFTGVSNIFRYDLQSKKVDAVSNTDTGFFRPVPMSDGRLLVFRYTGRGFVPTWIYPKPLEDVSAITFLGEQVIEERPVRKTWMLDSPAKVPFDTMEKQTGVCHHLAGGLRRESVYRRQGYKDTAAGGIAFNLSDPLMLNRLRLSAGWSPGGDLAASERAHLSAENANGTTGAPARRSTAPFLISSVRRRQDARGIEPSWGQDTLIFDEPRRLELDVSGSISGNLDRLPDYQNVPVDVGTLVTFGSALTFSDIRESLGSIVERRERSQLVPRRPH